MGALTKNERDALEDVFLSIHSHTDKYRKLKEISKLIMIKNRKLNLKKLVKRAKYGLKETKFINLLKKIIKKKKNLSK